VAQILIFANELIRRGGSRRPSNVGRFADMLTKADRVRIGLPNEPKTHRDRAIDPAECATASKGVPGMMLDFTVGINIAGERRSVTVSAEDALIAALKVKHQKPEATINYVRRSNRRGDRRHPHKSVAGDA
jgi:hypothetical protein